MPPFPGARKPYGWQKGLVALSGLGMHTVAWSGVWATVLRPIPACNLRMIEVACRGRFWHVMIRVMLLPRGPNGLASGQHRGFQTNPHPRPHPAAVLGADIGTGTGVRRFDVMIFVGFANWWYEQSCWSTRALGQYSDSTITQAGIECTKTFEQSQVMIGGSLLRLLPRTHQTDG